MACRIPERIIPILYKLCLNGCFLAANNRYIVSNTIYDFSINHSPKLTFIKCFSATIQSTYTALVAFRLINSPRAIHSNRAGYFQRSFYALCTSLLSYILFYPNNIIGLTRDPLATDFYCLYAVLADVTDNNLRDIFLAFFAEQLIQRPGAVTQCLDVLIGVVGGDAFVDKPGGAEDDGDPEGIIFSFYLRGGVGDGGLTAGGE